MTAVDPTKPYNPENVFAKILRGELPCTRVYEDEWVLAFTDLYPQAPVHILVIPKGAYVSLDDFTEKASDAEIAGFYRAVGHIAREQGLVVPGNRTISNTGPDAGQIIPHFHVHLCGGRDLGRMIPE